MEIENSENIETEVYEGVEGYALKGKFDWEKFRKINRAELSLKPPGENKLFNILGSAFRRKKLVINEYHEIEKAIDIKHTQGKIKLNLITKRNINEFLGKLKQEKRDKISYVYLAGIQIIIKSCFKEGINSPIILNLQDERCITAENGNLGIIKGNLAYKKLKFTCYPRYCVHINDKNLDDCLSLHFKMTNKILKDDNKVFTILYQGLYCYTNSNYGNIYKEKPFIEIDEEFRDIGEAILPREQDIEEIENFEIGHDDAISIDQPIIPKQITYKENKIIIGNNTVRHSISKIIQNKNNSVYGIKGKFFNGNKWINEIKILIDTGASQNHICSLIDEGIKKKKVEPYSYRDFEGKINSCDIIGQVQIKLGNLLLSIECYIDNNMNFDEHPILLGNSFLNSLDNYKIDKEGILIIHQGITTYCPKEK